MAPNRGARGEQPPDWEQEETQPEAMEMEVSAAASRRVKGGPGLRGRRPAQQVALREKRWPGRKVEQTETMGPVSVWALEFWRALESDV